MPDDSRRVRTETMPVVFAWGTPPESQEEGPGGLAPWLTGAAGLALWTAITWLLTA